FLNDGSGHYVQSAQIAVCSRSRDILSADLDADGDGDLVFLCPYANQVWVMLNDGNASFGSPVGYDAGTYCQHLDSGDFDGDTDLDLVITNLYGVSIVNNNGDATFGPPIPHDAGIAIIAVTTGDFNNDGRVDIAVTNSSYWTISMLLNNGEGGFESLADYEIFEHPFTIESADLDNDGDLDIIVNHTVFLNNGNGTLVRGARIAVTDFGFGYVRDMNGDGTNDVLLRNSVPEPKAGAVDVFLNNGDATFGWGSRYYTYAGSCIVGADIDNDGDTDVVLSPHSTLSGIAVLKNRVVR
ncbi:MAG: VCBS repeat-containing protein, partial [Candidatus Zixiibacteriota bacterium]